MFETLGLGVDFQFKNSGQGDMSKAMADMNNLYNTAGMTSDELTRLGNSFNTFADGLGGIGQKMMATGAVITGISGLAIKSAADFEEAFTGAIKYMSDTSTEGITKFQNQLSSTAKYLGITKEAILEATQEYMAMGLAQEEALKMAESVSYAGKVWDVLPAEAASAFKGIAAAYNLDMLVDETRNEFIDLINYVADQTALTGADSLSFLSAAGSGLKLIGRTDMEGALGIAAAARKAEVDITHLGYAMRTISKRYMNNGDEIFESIGVSIRDAAGELIPFDEALGKAAVNLQNYSQDVQSEWAVALGGLYSDDLLRTISGWSEYDRTMQAITSGNYLGSAAAEWEKITNTFNHNANVTKVIFTDFIQATFGQLLPILTSLMKPLNAFFGKITEWLSQHPLIGRFVAGFITLAGVFLLVGGAAILLSSKLLALRASITAAGGAANMAKGFFKGLGAVFNEVRPMMAGFIKQAASLALTMGAIYFVWKYDVFGIRSVLEQFTTDVKDAFSGSKELIKKDAVSIKTELANLDVSNNFVDKLKAFFVRVSLVWQGVKDLIMNDWILSDEMYAKLEAAGLLGVVTKIAMILYRLQLVWTGFKNGFASTMEAIRNIFTTIFKPVFDAIGNVILFVIEKVTDLMVAIGLMEEGKGLLDENTSKWEKFGEVLGGVAAVAATLFSVWKGFKVITAPISFIRNLRGGTGPLPSGDGGSGGSGSGGGSGGSGGRGGGNPLVQSPVNILKAMGNLALIIGGFTILVAAYGALSKIPGFNQFMASGLKTLKSLFVGVASLAVNIGIIAVLVYGMSKISPTNALKAFGSLAIVVGGFTLIIAAYGLLSMIPGFDDFLSRGCQTLDNLFRVMGTFASGNLLLMIAGITLMGLISPMTMLSGMASLAVVLGGFTLIISAFALLASIPGFDDFITRGGQSLDNLFGVMGVFMSSNFLIMTAAVIAMGLVSPATMLSGILGLATLLGGFTVLIAAYGALAMIPGFNEFIASGGETLALLFNAIGYAFGALVGGVMDGISASLPNIGQSLADFAVNIQPFFTIVGNAPTEEIGKFMTSFGAFLLMLTGEQILSLFTGGVDLAQLGSDLGAFGTSAAGFFNAVAGYPDEGIEKAKKVFDSVTSLGGYATKTGGLAQLFTGTTNLPQLGSDLSDFATNAETFYNTIVDYPAESIVRSKNVFDSVTSLGGYATKTGGLAQLFTGTTDLPQLGSDLSDFATNAETFYVKVSEYPYEGISRSKLVFEALSAISGYEFKSGGMAQWFTGTTDISSVGTQMSNFATNVEEYFNIVAKIGLSTFDKSERLFESISAISGYEFKSGGLAQVFTGEVDLTIIGDQLSSFGTSIKGYFDVAAGLEYSSITKGKQMFEALEGVSEFIGAGVMLDGSGLSSLGTGLSDFATNAVTFFNTADTVNVEGVTIMIETIGNFFGVFNNFDTSTLTTASAGMDAVGTSVVTLGTNLQTLTADVVAQFSSNISNLIETCTTLSNISINTEALNGIGSSIVIEISNGVTNNAPTFKTAVEGAFNQVVPLLPNNANAVEGAFSTLSENGKSIPSVIGTGVTENQDSLKNGMMSAFTYCASVLPGGSSGSLSYSALLNSGYKIVATIASGINQNSYVIKNAMDAAFSRAARSLPHSDALEGPFSDLTGSGKAIPETIAQGIRANSSAVQSALNKLDSSISTDVDGNVDLAVRSSGLNSVVDNITVVFINILGISQSIYENFARIDNPVPAYAGTPAYSGRMNNIYDNRVDTNNVQNVGGMEVVFQPGAFQINIGSSDPDSVRSVLPELQASLESTVVDIIRKLKDERYEI